MKKSVSLLTSLCLAVTSAAAVITPAVSSADDSRKGFSISTYRDSDSIYAALGNTVTIPTSYVNEGDVVIPCALYYTEQTNDTQTISVQLTINSEDGDPKSPTFTLYSPTASYFAEAKTFSTALGDATTNKYVSFAGKVTKRGTFSPSGTAFPVCEEKMLSASTTNYYIGYSWFCVDGYNWAGYTSDQYPLFVFDVTFPQGTAPGTYTIDYCNYNTNQSGSTINQLLLLLLRLLLPQKPPLPQIPPLQLPLNQQLPSPYLPLLLKQQRPLFLPKLQQLLRSPRQPQKLLLLPKLQPLLLKLQLPKILQPKQLQLLL